VTKLIAVETFGVSIFATSATAAAATATAISVFGKLTTDARAAHFTIVLINT
jgi:hypothetical protein